MKTPEARVSTHSSPKSNKSASLRRGLWQAGQLGASRAAGSSRDTLAAEVSEPFAHVIGTSLPVPVEGRGPRRPARRIASRLPVNSLILQNIWDLRPPVSVEVRMRETTRTRQQAYPDISWPLLYGGGSTNPAQLGFGSRFLAAGFRTFEKESSQNLVRYHVSLIA